MASGPIAAASTMSGTRLGAIVIAAAGLGWQTQVLDDLGTEELALLMGTGNDDAESEGRWGANAGRPTRFKPSSPSPTDGVRDGSAKLRSSGSERDTASTASRCCPDERRARRPSPTIDVYRKNAFSTRAC